MTNQHPITPPPELQRLWAQQAQRLTPHDITGWLDYVATQAARWGADQELEAILKLAGEPPLLEWDRCFVASLREERRPKPPTLKEFAYMRPKVIDVDDLLAIADELEATA